MKAEQVMSRNNTANHRKDTQEEIVNRKYGEYMGGGNVSARVRTAAPQQKSSNHRNNTVGGYSGGRKTRCTDKFVRYPYPKTLLSGY